MMQPSELVGPVVVHSADTILYANEEFCDLVGVSSPTDVIDTSLTDFVADQYHAELTHRFDQLLHDETPPAPRGVHLELTPEDGTTREAIAISSLVAWESETQVHTSFIDLSLSDPTPITSPRTFAVHDSPIGVTIADASQDDLPLTYVNDAFVELTGYSREEALGRNCRFLQGDATREEPVAELREAIAAERPVTVELRNYRNDGSMFWNRVSISPVEDETGTVTHFPGSVAPKRETYIDARDTLV